MTQLFLPISVFDLDAVLQFMSSEHHGSYRLRSREGETPSSRTHLIRRLANGLASVAPGECWVWIRATNGVGYGTLWADGKQAYAHRLAYHLSRYGPIPDHADVIMHRCDNPPCINPDHLRPGTYRDNTNDSVRKGRARRATKLKRPEVRQILRRLDGGEPQRSIARDFGVDQRTVSLISRGETWAHVSRGGF